MKRYTFKSGDDYYVISGEECFDDQDENYSGPAIDKLAEYENLKEAGKLIVLPCKIGDAVYRPGYKFTACSAYDITPKCRHDIDCEDCCCECDSESIPYLYEGRVTKLEVLSNGEVKVYAHFKDAWDNSGYIVGRELFLTRKDAEAKLKI